MLGASAPPARPAVGYIPPPPPPLTTSSGSPVRVVAWILAGLLGAVGAWWGMDRLRGGYDFPQEIAGVGFVESGEAGHMIPWAQATNTDVEVGLYGSSLAPEYMLAVIELPEERSPDAVWSAISTMSDDPSDLRTMGPDGQPARFVCGSNPQLPSSGACVWMEGDLIVELDAPNLTSAELRPTAHQVFQETFDS